jgi:hypothetical protein
MLKRYVRHLVDDRVGPAANRVSLVVNDELFRPVAQSQRGELEARTHEPADAVWLCAISPQVAQGHDGDAEVFGKGEAIKGIVVAQAKLLTQLKSQDFGCSLEATR